LILIKFCKQPLRPFTLSKRFFSLNAKPSLSDPLDTEKPTATVQSLTTKVHSFKIHIHPLSLRKSKSFVVQSSQLNPKNTTQQKSLKKSIITELVVLNVEHIIGDIVQKLTHVVIPSTLSPQKLLKLNEIDV